MFWNIILILMVLFFVFLLDICQQLLKLPCWPVFLEFIQHEIKVAYVSKGTDFLIIHVHFS